MSERDGCKLTYFGDGMQMHRIYVCSRMTRIQDIEEKL